VTTSVADSISILQVQRPPNPLTPLSSSTFKHAEKLGPISPNGLSQQQATTYHNYKLTWDGVYTLQDMFGGGSGNPFSKGRVFGVIKIDNVSISFSSGP